MDMRCDVLVAGAGVAGVCAAVAASRAHARTILVEKTARPGGTAIFAMHRFMAGLFLNGPDLPAEPLNPGLTFEIYERLRSLNPGEGVRPMGKVYVLPFQTGHLESLFREMLTRGTDLQVMFNTTVVSVAREGDRIATVAARQDGKMLRIVPGAVIDCTGDGVVVQLCHANLPPTPLRDTPLAGFTLRFRQLAGVDDALAVKVPYCAVHGVAEKTLPECLRFTAFYPGHLPDEGYCKLSVPGEMASTPEQVLEAGRRLHRCLADRLPAFRQSVLAETSPGVLNREGARLDGEYVLTREDVLQARQFPDGVAKNAWPIELWNREKGPGYEYLEPGRYYEIPLRCLKSRTVPNLLAAGRCISAASEALASARVMGPCIALGQAAGETASRSPRRN